MTKFIGRDRLARVALTVAANPADRTIGILTHTLGADRTAALLAGETSTELPDQVSQSMVAEATRSTGTRLNAARAQQVIDTSRARGWTILIPSDPDWPTQLDDLGEDAPYALFVTGNPGLLSATQRTSIVGARAATGYGELQAVEITVGLVQAGHAIVSGAAYGIDGVAHRAALTSDGGTVAVLAGGLDRYYPVGHQALLERIAQVGAIATEAAPGTPPTRWRFLTRNRLIAALTPTTVVVEAGTRSGALSTAGHAQKLARDIAAVPGPVTSAASAGCHHLISQGLARLVTSADDILHP